MLNQTPDLRFAENIPIILLFLMCCSVDFDDLLMAIYFNLFKVVTEEFEIVIFIQHLA